MTYNIRAGFGSDDVYDRRTLHLERVISVLKDIDADIVALQEVDRFCRRSGGVDQPRAIGEALGMKVSRFATMPFDGGDYGLVMLSRVSPLAMQCTAYPMHPDLEPRGGMVVRFSTARGDLLVAGTHFQVGDTMHEVQNRRRGMETLARMVGEANVPTVVLGDFNCTPDSGEMGVFSSFDVGDNQSTHPATVRAEPSRCIDYVLSSRGMTVQRSVWITPESSVASDHYPVTGEIEMV